MYLTNKSYHAVTVMVDIMLHSQNQSVPVRVSEIVGRQPISVSYIENLFIYLVKASLVKGIRGPNGGYVLKKMPDQITIADIIRATSKPLKDGYCGKEDCNHSNCITAYLWEGLGQETDVYLSKLTLADLIPVGIDN
jgi:Rrf2 family iron-sulfur cluster assembly transcriptional regulator